MQVSLKSYYVQVRTCIIRITTFLYTYVCVCVYFSQIGQVFYGFFFSSEVAYFGYLYAMTDDKRYYQRITGQARAACLSGKFFSSLFAQTVSVINGSVPFVWLVYLSVSGKYL